MSHAHSHDNIIPRPALFMAGGLIAASLFMTASVSLGFLDREAVPSVAREAANVAPQQVRRLQFADTSAGAVRITDADSGREIALIETETPSSGFIRGVLRGLARERRMHGIGAEPAFALTLWQDGSLSLQDEATGRSLELGAFGSDNRAAFIALLANGETT